MTFPRKKLSYSYRYGRAAGVSPFFAAARWRQRKRHGICSLVGGGESQPEGLRRRRPDSPNGGWQNASFQGYADYMLTPEFEQSLQELIERARGERAALLCAEAVPWRCHRSLIADALTVRGIAVEHILGARRTRPHVLRAFARVEGTRITYPPTDPEADEHVQGS
jgi:hypothetical protein